MPASHTLSNPLSRTPSLSPFLGRRQLFFFTPDDGGNTQGGNTQGGGGADPQQAFQNLIARNNNDLRAVAELLFRENHEYRQQNAQLRTQVPAQGAVVLTAEQGQQWQAYQALGAPADLETARTRLGSLERGERIRTVADAAGYKAPVLDRLAGELAMEVRDGEGGKKTVVVKDGDKETPIAEYAKTHWADFLPALQGTTPQAQGTSFVPQHAGGSVPTGTIAEQMLQQFQSARDNAPNPLAPKKSS